ncbi:tripartite tricarboxylate transporter permease [Faunimonas sp. B44]|uniref:tripartite tricarboxylate transporter permease n=1 Tax=Faunimonas sp. B44 TaxID=3461493 RepID=UPI004044DE5C
MDLTLFDFAMQALGQLLGPHLVYLLLGVVLGLAVGILPGLGGISGMALILPFVYGMDQGAALAMMIGLTSVTTTSDTFPSVLLGVPGSSGSQATVVDGFPLAKRGEGARALSAAFASSLLGGVFGALLLTFAFVFARPLLLAVGFAEQMMLVLLALSLVGMLTGQSMLKGLASCGLGLLIGTIGASVATAEYRMTFGSVYLTDGLPLLIIGLGLFAVPEILDVLRHRIAISDRGSMGHGWIQGLKDVIANKWLVLRCSAIGSIIGALPGLGGTVIDWIAYAHVVQTSKDRSKFGHGDIRGVIAPESANNAKEGGALIPTLFLGIPGSGTMALLLGGLVLIGVTPGRNMVNQHVDLVYVIIWSIALANVFGAVICIGLARPIASLTAVPYALIAPFMIVLIYFAAFQTSRDWGDLVALPALGLLGVFMKRFGWSRAALLIGFVLSQSLEDSVSRTVQIYGFSILQRPVALAILLAAFASAYLAWRSRASTALGEAAASVLSRRRKGPQLAFTLFVLAFAVVVIIDTVDLRFLAYVFPVTAAVVTLALGLGILGFMLLRPATSGVLYDAEAERREGEGQTGSTTYYFAWFLALPALTLAVGFFLASPLYIAAFLRILGRRSWLSCAAGGAAAALLLWVLARFLSLHYPQGWIETIVPVSRWLL